MRDVLLAASLRTPSIDPQVDSRHAWVASMIESSDNPAFYVERVIRAGVDLRKFGHTRDSRHRIGIIQYFARADEYGCRSWMLQNLAEAHLEDAWLKVVGPSGIVDVARSRGAMLGDQSRATILFPYRMAVSESSEQEVRELLEQEAQTDPNVAAYLETVERFLRRTDSATRSALPRDTFDFSAIDPDLKWPRLRPWFKNATTAQLEKALDWIEHTDSEIKWRLLSSWTRSGQPLHRFSEPLFAWASADIGSASDKDVINREARLNRHSQGLLGTRTDPRVRELGVARFDQNDLSAGCALLAANWQNGDAVRLVGSLPFVLPNTLDDRDERHSLAHSITDLLSAVVDPALATAASWVYVLNPCAVCRNDAVEWLRESEAFTTAMEAEYRADVWNCGSIRQS